MLVPSDGRGAGPPRPAHSQPLPDSHLGPVPAAMPKSAMLERRSEVVVERMAVPNSGQPLPLAPPAAYVPIAAAARSPGRQGPQGVHPSTVEVRELRAELEQLAQQYGALHEHAGLIHIQHQDCQQNGKGGG